MDSVELGGEVRHVFKNNRVRLALFQLLIGHLLDVLCKEFTLVLVKLLQRAVQKPFVLPGERGNDTGKTGVEQEVDNSFVFTFNRPELFFLLDFKPDFSLDGFFSPSDLLNLGVPGSF